MTLDLKLKYLGSGVDSHGVKHAVLELTRTGVGSRNFAVPFVPVNGLDPVQTISKAMGSLDVPAITTKAKSALLEECQSVVEAGSLSGKTAIIADQPGWLPNGQYLTPAGKLLGQKSGPVAVSLSGIARVHRWSTEGSVCAWKGNARLLASGNPAVIFGCCSALGGPLLKIVGLEGVIFCFLGPTSTGKTSTLDFAGSVVGGDPHHKNGFRSSWKTTENAIEVIAREGNDGLVILDDTLLLVGKGKGKGEALASMISDLVSGGEKRRFNNPTGSAAHRIIAWSSSNTPLRDVLVKAGVDYGEMYQVRYIEIPAKWRFGMFNAIPEGLTPSELSSALSHSSRQNYGTVYKAFLRRLIKWNRKNPRKLAAFLKARRAEAMKAMGISGTEEGAGRAAKYFALVYQAGCLARRFGIMPWGRKRLLAAVVDCWDKHRLHVTESTGGSSPLVTLRQFIHGHAHEFVNMGAPVASLTKKARKRVPGFIRQHSSGDIREYIFLEDVLRGALGGQDRVDLLVAELRQKGLLIMDGNKTCPKRLLTKGWRPRVYCVNPRLLTEM